MLVDFCHWSLKPSISCDKPSSDSYEVQNLISSDPSVRQRGFLAETFIKPPVNVTFSFPCKVSIHQIFINPVVGGQKSTSLEIYTESNRINSSWLSQVDTLQSGSPRRLFESPFFLNIGRMSFQEPCRICFTYARFNATPPYSVSETSLDGCKTSALRNHRHQYLTSVSKLTVRILQTSGSCVPALKSIQIFGQPAVSNGRQIVEKVYYIYLQSFAPAVLKTAVETPEISKNDKRVEVESGLDIPEDFLDPITWEIMALPMLLPSGKTLDQSTLDRYTDNEASWGRRPNDPFTGVAFSPQLTPIMNESLKTRIDSFLLKHSSDSILKTVPRTVGRKVDMVTVGTKHGKRSSGAIHPSVSKIVGITSAVEKRHRDTEDVPALKPKRSKIDHTASHVDHSNCTNGDPGPSISEQSVGKLSNLGHSSQSHESQLTSSLSQAMSVLSGLPSFTRKSASKQCPVNKVCTCVGCRVTLDDSVIAYKLQCSHLICRQCLLQPGAPSASTVKCAHCGDSSHVAQVTRIHVV